MGKKFKNVLITCDLFPPEARGGTEIIAFNIAKVLKNSGYEVRVFCRALRENVKSIDGIKTFRAKLRKWFLANILCFPKIYALAKKADVIHNFTFDTAFASYLAALIQRKPLIISVMGVYGDSWVEMKKSWIKGKIRKFFEKFYLKIPCEKMIFLSEHSKKLGIKLGAPKNKSLVIVPGVDSKRFKPAKKKEKYVLFVGRLVPQKGVRYLIEASRMLPEIRFVIVGDGAEKKVLENLAGENVKFEGFVPFESKKLEELYAKALVFCLPSIEEGLGIVHLEAMAAGCAIVSTIPFDYAGFLVEKRNPKAIAEKLKLLFSNKKLVEKLGKENRKRAEKYKWENILQVYEELEKGRGEEK